MSGETLHVKIAAAPEKGKANKELIDFLSERLDVRKSSIQIVKGETSRNKVVSIEGLDGAEAIRRLGV